MFLLNFKIQGVGLMVILMSQPVRVPNYSHPEIPQGEYKHLATEWELWDKEIPKLDTEETGIANKITEDTEKRIVIFDIPLELGKTYYARARELRNDGWSKWSKVKTITPKDINERLENTHMPFRTPAPTVSTDYDTSAHPSGNFYIRGSEFMSLGATQHLSSTFFITDIEGNVLWSLIDSETDLTETFVDVFLPANNIYILHVSYRGTNGNASIFASEAIYVSDDATIPIVEELLGVDLDDNENIYIRGVDGYDGVDWSLIDGENGNTLHADTTTTGVITIPEESMVNNLMLLKLEMTVNSKRGDVAWRYIIPTNPNMEAGSDVEIPYGQTYESTGFPYTFPISF